MSVDVHFAPTDHPSQGINPKPSPNPLPWVPLPRAALHDPRLTATDRDVLSALLEVARNDPTCYPSNRTLAQVIGKSVRTVQLSLRRLVVAGWIRLRPTAANPTGRLIDLCWRTSQTSTPPVVQSVAPPVVQSVAPPVVQSPPAPECRHPDADLPVKSPAPVKLAALLPVKPAAPLPVKPAAPDVRIPEVEERDVTSPTLPLLEELQAVGPTTTPTTVRRLASRLAAALEDVASLGFYISVLAQVVGGTLPVLCLVAAYRAGARAVGRAQRPGAIFAFTLKSYIPPPLPSSIRYYQQPSQPPALVVTCAVGGTPSTDHSAGDPPTLPSPGDELSPEEEVALWKKWSEIPNHPCYYYAQRRLERLAGEQVPTV